MLINICDLFYVLVKADKVTFNIDLNISRWRTL